MKPTVQCTAVREETALETKAQHVRRIAAPRFLVVWGVTGDHGGLFWDVGRWMLHSHGLPISSKI